MLHSLRILRLIKHPLVSVMLSLCFVALAASLLSSDVCQAQDANAIGGVIVGTVTGLDQEKLVGVEAALSRENPRPSDPPTTTATDKDGRFEFEGLSPGSYAVALSLPGWSGKRLSHLKVLGGNTVDLAVTLRPAEIDLALPLITFLRSDPLARTDWWGMQFGSVALQGLPTSRTIWSVLDGEETSVVVDKFEYGGLQVGRPALFGAHGASWRENSYFLNGLDVTDPYAAGRPMINPDYDAIADMTVVTASKSALLPNSGVDLNITTPQPPSKLHGAVRNFYSARPLQGNNMDARLLRLKFPGPEIVNQLDDGGAQLGGLFPAGQYPWPYFVSVSTQQLSKSLGGFSLPIDAHAHRLLAQVAPYVKSSRRLDLLYSAQQNFNSRDGADPAVAPEATQITNDNFQQFQARWHQSLGVNSLLQVLFGVVHANLSSGLQNGFLSVSTLDLPLLDQGGSAPLSLQGARTRYEFAPSVATTYNGVFGHHSFILGADFDRSEIHNSWNAFGGVEQILLSGQPSELIHWNTPARASDYVQNLSAYVQDEWRLARWVSLPLGLRLENSSGLAYGAPNRIVWTDLQPRLGIVFPLPGRMTFRGGWNRYGHLLQGQYLDYGNPAAIGGRLFRSQGGVPGQLLQVFGGPYSAVDPNLHRPVTDEISLSLERQFGEHFGVRARGFRRDDHNLIEPFDVGVPFSDYTPTLVTDPGFDGIFGTSDDQHLLLYNENPSALGKDFTVLSNPPGYKAMYEGVEAEFMERYSSHWEAGLTFAAMLTSARTNTGYTPYQNDTGVIGPFFTGPPIPMLGASPNAQLFSPGLSYFDRGKFGKLHVYYRTNHNIQIGFLARYYDGLPFGRLLFVDNFNQGPFLVRAMPYSNCCTSRTQHDLTADVRIRRDFPVGRGILSGIFDCFNILNSNNNTIENDLTGTNFLQRIPLAIQAPRLARIGAEWTF